MNRIAIIGANDQTTVTVSRWPSDDAPYQISTAAQARDISGLPQPLRKAISRRNQHGGTAKGRVLYAEQMGLRSERITVGALILHVTQKRDIEILNLGTAYFKEGQDRMQVVSLMLACVDKIAIELGCSAVTWLAHNKQAANAAAAFGFRRLRRGRSTPRGTICCSRQVQK